jgi:hypothetical protein
MKHLFLFYTFLYTVLLSQAQDFLNLQDLGVGIIYGDIKFNNAYSSQLKASQNGDYTTPKTVWMIDVLPTASFFLAKRANIIVQAGIEAHKIRNDFRKDLYYLDPNSVYKPFATNYLYKAGIGSEIFLLGSRNKLLNLRLQSILTYENLIRRNTGNYFALGPFGTKVIVYDYAKNTGRLGLDVMPLLNINLSQVYSVKLATGYSFGLNNSNTRVASVSGSLLNAVEIFSRKESTFIFSAGLFYNMQPHIKRASVKTFNLQKFMDKIIYNE